MSSQPLHVRPDVKVFPVDTPNGPSYRYKIGDEYSLNYYATPGSAWHDARRPQSLVLPDPLGPWRTLPSAQVVRT